MSDEFLADAGDALASMVAGSRIAGYRLEGQIGAGGMAVVFRAVDERLGRRVALKVLAPALAADHAFRQRFIRESRAAAAVDDPHIIPVHEAGEAGGVLFIAMRYVPGGDVRTLLDREGPLSPARAAAVISPVASALDAAHEAGLVHRDVKPANMLVDVRPDRPDHVYLSDFGLSKGMLSSVGLTGSGQFLGTPSYIAPEQIEGQAVDGRTDQYALACTAFELLTGEAPFQRDQGMAVIWAHLSQPPPSLASRQPGLPTAADEVFARALAKAPEDRYASCREFADALRTALGLAPYHSGPGVIPADHPATEFAWPASPSTKAAGRADTPAGASSTPTSTANADHSAPEPALARISDESPTITSAPPPKPPMREPTPHRHRRPGALLRRRRPTPPQVGTRAYVTNQEDGTVTPIDLATNKPGKRIKTGKSPKAIAITPDGTRAYVAGASGVTPIDLTINKPGTPIDAGYPEEIAITPDGRRAYALSWFGSGLDPIVPIDLATNKPGTPIDAFSFPALRRPLGIAITPDGAKAYVSSESGVTPISLATNKPGKAIKVGNPYAIAITPDGRRAYVTSHQDGTVTPISTATGKVLKAIRVAVSPKAIAITPDSKTAYVTDYWQGTITPVNLATSKPGTPIKVRYPVAIAITPDGTSAYVASSMDGPDGWVTPIDLATGAPGTPITVGHCPSAIAITG